jgi:hypothetical protein
LEICPEIRAVFATRISGQFIRLLHLEGKPQANQAGHDSGRDTEQHRHDDGDRRGYAHALGLSSLYLIVA